jgi:hypothetical protein
VQPALPQVLPVRQRSELLLEPVPAVACDAFSRAMCLPV